ncbi:carbonic anhydrase [Salarchaeum sp. JOR-1]|uniref:carbonic anhydrase n=1 Tax=Salarchaeum sp. JOR-1 TaxID=2599399 RepID=UPI0011986E4E|nr:carbonic anhydrase [Salarchaeum sp. JOR-1]QDX41552.1 IcfA [Salarchaeum sp. JOR-1]
MDTLAALLAGNDAHVAAFRDRFDDVQDAQRPDAVTVCCSDSRVLQDHMWGNDQPGRVFTCSNIGNRVVQRTAAGTVVAGDVLYPIAHTDTDLAVVVGHSGCGAVTATYDAITTDIVDEPPGIEHCIGLLRPELEPCLEHLPDGRGRADTVNDLVECNVDQQVRALRESEDVPDDTTVAGVVYDFQNAYDGARGEAHVVNVDGERDPEVLRDRHPTIAGRVQRRVTY